MVEHPNYPELNGLAQVTYDSVARMVRLKFCDDGSVFIGNLQFVRIAEPHEIEAFMRKSRKKMCGLEGDVNGDTAG
ncbi:hypothetical protein [Lysinibacillus sphaericus]|uniref:hypothetical protein n=1 Tax=Lysinibacillus sphaericus TaxID=1421 RepID=UPI003F79F620